MEMRLLILFSVVVALTSAQTVTVGGNLTNTISNSGNSFKPLSKNSGNVFKNQYHVSVGPEKEVKDREEDEMTKGKDDVIGQLNLLQRVSQVNQCSISQIHSYISKILKSFFSNCHNQMT